MSNPWIILIATVAIIAASAFFVAVEFALIAAKRHRLEDAAPHSRSARAALRSSTELSVLLAGSQLGITVCTLALGAITKPAVHHWITPVAEATGMPLWIADVVGFVLALIIVTFLHLVVGEMAPKSWAVAHPERSAIMLALPMRAFMVVTRPLLVVLNNLANACLRLIKVDPVNQVDQGQTADDLRQLLQHSVTSGTLAESESKALVSALDLSRVRVADLVIGHEAPVAVGPGATAGEVREASRRSGHLRIPVRGDGVGPDGHPTHVVHVRDTLTLENGDAVADLLRPVLALDGDLALHEALTAMREQSTHLALVRLDEDALGIITLSDVLGHLLVPSEQAA